MKLAALFVVLPLAAQSLTGIRAGQVQSVPVDGAAGAGVAFEVWVEELPREHAESVAPSVFAIEREPGRVTLIRTVRDYFRKVFVAYRVTLEEADGGLRVSFADSGVPAPADSRPIVPVYPAPQIVREGEILEIELYRDPATGQRLVDYLHLGKASSVVPRKQPARDSFADDAEFDVERPRFRVNGEVKDAADVTVHGRLLRLTIPELGAFVLSLKPHAGFERMGEVTGNSIVLRLGADVLRIDCAERVAEGSGSYHVYARREGGGSGERIAIGPE